MKKKLQYSFALLIMLSMILAACATPTAAPVVEPTQPVQVVEPTAVIPVATEAQVVSEEPAALDFTSLFTTVTASMDPAKGFSSVSATALSESLADNPPFLVDVRETSEVEKDGYIEGAVNIPIRDLLKNLDKLPGLDDPIVIYCGSGHRGAIGLAALKMLGYTDVRNLGGGTGAWKKAELALVTGSMPPAAESISTPIVADQALFTALDSYLSNIPEGFYTSKAASLNEALASDQKPFLLDVRTDAEVARDGYIEGSVHLPISDLMQNLDQLPADKEQPVVVYCASGHRGAVAMFALQELGYTNVLNLGGGIGAWKSASMPVAGVVDWQTVWGEFMASLPADQGFYSIKADVLNTALAEDPPFLLDVRETSEVEANGYIEGAINIPVRDVMKNLDKLPALDQPIVVYCGSGHRGSFTMAALRVLGYTNVLNLGGGTGAWKKAEFALATGQPPAPQAGEAPAVDEVRLRDLDAFFSNLPEGFLGAKAVDVNTDLAAGTALNIVDLRPEKDYSAGHIEGAINIPVNDLFAQLAQIPDKAAPTIVACSSGHRGGIALIALTMSGYTDVRNLGGGMSSWAAAELPVVQ